MNVFDFINEKRLGGEHSEADIREFIREYTDGNIPDYQAAAWLMAVCIQGMTPKETAVLTDAMAHSGEMLDPLPGKFCVDKHSTGGVGDKVTLFAAPVCAACGVYVPKMSGRGLGYTGGTIDKLESIPGFRTSLDYNEFISIVEKNGFAVAGQTGHLVPADKKLYALRDATATVESIPLICSSIMSKKIATGADGLVLDVKSGSGAFMKDAESAEKLALAMLSAAKSAGMKCTAVITDMSRPLGKNVGNALEVIEAIEALKGNYSADFYEVASEITAEMLMLAGVGDENECRRAVEEAVKSGRALEAFERTVKLQGGNGNICHDYSLFGEAEYKKEIYACRSGYINGISCDITGMCSLELGAGRHKLGDSIDMNAGIAFNVSVGDKVSEGDLLAVLHTSDSVCLEDISKRFEGAFSYCDEKVTKSRNVIKILRNS